MLHKLSSLLNNKTDHPNLHSSSHPFSLKSPNQNRSSRKNDNDFHDPFDFFLPRNHSKNEMLTRHPSGQRDEEKNLNITSENGQTGPINTFQEIVKVVETAMPLIEEYGPMIKKIPSLLPSFKKSSDKK